MAHCFDESHRAYESGDGARAKDLSNEGKRHKSEMERINKEASDWIYYRAFCSPFGFCSRARADEVGV